MNYRDLICPENLFNAWDEFKCGKRKKPDVMQFERNLETNIFNLHQELADKTYCHGSYSVFNIWDPKYRTISKASVKDRVVHHMLFNYLYEVFDRQFLYHSYSSRYGKGTHLGVENLHRGMGKVSHNFSYTAYALKGDIRKFFASVNHEILLHLIAEQVSDPNIFALTRNIIESYKNSSKTGIPLGNVTSQLFANIYLDQLDQYIKHQLKMRYYFRYADDFVILHKNKAKLENLTIDIRDFLSNYLRLTLHPNKVSIRKISQGVDFLGYVCLPHHRVIRTKTKKRMFLKVEAKKQLLLNEQCSNNSFNQTQQSYLGILKHADGYKLQQQLKEVVGNVLDEDY